jgi:hypothetical protein
MQDKNNLNELSIGAILEWRSDNLYIGSSVIALDYDKPIYSKSKSAFWGRSGFLSSIYGHCNFGDFTISSELSRDASGNFGIKSSIVYEQNKWSTALLFRSFAGDFRSPFGYNFGESSIPSNETGLYWGVNLRLVKDLNISAYFDIFNNYSRTYDIAMPGRGNEIFTEIEWKLSAKTFSRLRLRYENKTMQAIDETTSFYRLFQSTRYSIRTEIEHSVATKLRFRGRIEAVLFLPEKIMSTEKGIVGFIELTFLPIKDAKIGARIAYFSTDSYYSAIWQYEAVMPGIMSAPALYGKGSRAYIFAKITPVPFLDIWAKYSFTCKNDVKVLGTGWEEIPSNNENRILLQIELKF